MRVQALIKLLEIMDPNSEIEVYDRASHSQTKISGVNVDPSDDMKFRVITKVR